MTSADTLFISDLHLDESKPHLTRLFKHFCESMAPKAKAIYILGDFFDVWYSDSQQSPWITETQQLIAGITQQGIPVWLMVGNRDFMLGERFAKACGCQLLADPSVITIGKDRIALCHGDSLCRSDQSYQRFRYWIRHPITRFITRCIPNVLLGKIAKNIRQSSQEKNATPHATPHDNQMVDADAVRELCEQQQSRYLIHGHTHVEGTWDMPDNITRLVLNMWDDKGHGLAWSDNGERKFFCFDEKNQS